MRITLALLSGFLLMHTASAATLTIYSRLAAAPAMVRAFTARTGIATRLRRPPPAGMVARIIAEGAHPHWSLAWFDGASTAVMLDRRGLLARHLPHSEGAYVVTGAALPAVLLMAKSAPFAPPVRWHDLNDPAYHGLIGMNDPQTSDQSFATLAALLQSAGGWPDGQGFLRALKRNGLHIYADSRTTVAALRSGAIQIAILRGPTAARVASTIDPSLRVVVPQPAGALPRVIVMAKSLHGVVRADAERFIAFAASRPLTISASIRLDAQRWGQVQGIVTHWFVTDIVGPGT